MRHEIYEHGANLSLMAVFCMAAMLLVLGIAYAVKRAPIAATEVLVKREADLRIKNFKDMSTNPNRLDVWGNLLFFNVELTEEVATVTVRSFGPDGIDKTKDDIQEVRTDFNKSLLIGRAIGSKSKEMAKGIWEGLKADRKHEVPEQE